MAKGGAIKNQADHFRLLARNYGRAAFGSMVAALFTGVCLYMYVSQLNDNSVVTKNLNAAMAAVSLMPRLVTVTLLSTALIFFIRNFSAMMHNYVVNRHRQTALTTFQIFASGTTDAATKNSVLVQSTQAIFAPQPSGYLKTDQEMPQMNQVTEIVRGVTGKDDK